MEMRELETHCVEGRKADTRYQQFTEACRHCVIIRALGGKQKGLAQHLSIQCLFLYLSFDDVFKPTVQNHRPPLVGGTAAKSLAASEAMAKFSWSCLPALPVGDEFPEGRMWESWR